MCGVCLWLDGINIECTAGCMDLNSLSGTSYEGAALAVISQARLLAASELWNGNPRFKDFKNKDGELLAPQTKDQESGELLLKPPKM